MVAIEGGRWNERSPHPCAQERTCPPTGPPRWSSGRGCGRRHAGHVPAQGVRACGARRREILRISALGLYRAFINGVRVGNDLLTPGWTSYDKRLSYQTYEVGTLLARRQHHRHLARRRLVPLADDVGEEPHPQHLGQRDRGDRRIARRRRRGCLSSSRPTPAGRAASCRSSSPASISARSTMPGWRRSRPTAAAGGRVRHRPARPARDCGRCTSSSRSFPSLTWKDAEDRTIYDFGQNIAGYVAFKVKGEAGARVIVEHSEIVDRDNSFDNRNYRTAEARVEYILKGGGEESYARSSPSRASAMPASRSKARRSSHRSFRCRSARRRRRPAPSRPAIRWSTGWSRTRSGRSAPTSSKCRPIARSATSGWAGPATRRSLRRRPAICTTAHDFLRKWLRDVMADQRDDGAIPHVFPDPTRLTRTISRLLRLDRLGRRDLRGPMDALAALRRPRRSSRRPCRRWSSGSISSGRSATARSCAAARLGRARLHLRRLAAAEGSEREAVADHRRRCCGDDLSLHLVGI